MNMIVRDAKIIALYSDIVNAYPETVALFTTGTSVTPPPPVEPPLLGWNYRGCYTDSVSARTLGNTAQVPGGAAGISIEAYITVCQSGGWALTGILSTRCRQIFMISIPFLGSPPKSYHQYIKIELIIKFVLLKGLIKENERLN